MIHKRKKIRTKKNSPYDFQDDDNTTLSRSKNTKLLTDDIITARFAKNSHYQSHQTSMASTKSSKSNEREHKKKKEEYIRYWYIKSIDIISKFNIITRSFIN